MTEHETKHESAEGIARGLNAIDQKIGGEPGSGLYLLLDTLSADRFGTTKTPFPSSPPPRSDALFVAPVQFLIAAGYTPDQAAKVASKQLATHPEAAGEPAAPTPPKPTPPASSSNASTGKR
jgi:hypothetical protein